MCSTFPFKILIILSILQLCLYLWPSLHFSEFSYSQNLSTCLRDKFHKIKPSLGARHCGNVNNTCHSCKDMRFSNCQKVAYRFQHFHFFFSLSHTYQSLCSLNELFVSMFDLWRNEYNQLIYNRNILEMATRWRKTKAIWFPY